MKKFSLISILIITVIIILCACSKKEVSQEPLETLNTNSEIQEIIQETEEQLTAFSDVDQIDTSIEQGTPEVLFEIKEDIAQEELISKADNKIKEIYKNIFDFDYKSSDDFTEKIQSYYTDIPTFTEIELYDKDKIQSLYYMFRDEEITSFFMDFIPYAYVIDNVEDSIEVAMQGMIKVTLTHSDEKLFDYDETYISARPVLVYNENKDDFDVACLEFTYEYAPGYSVNTIKDATLRDGLIITGFDIYCYEEAFIIDPEEFETKHQEEYEK